MSHTSSENPQSGFRFNIFQGQLGLSEVKLGSNRHGWSKYIKYTYNIRIAILRFLRKLRIFFQETVKTGISKDW